jgi:hypothetical protein
MTEWARRHAARPAAITDVPAIALWMASAEVRSFQFWLSCLQTTPGVSIEYFAHFCC